MAQEQNLSLREDLDKVLGKAKEKFLLEGMSLQRENENYGPSLEKIGELELSKLGMESKIDGDNQRCSQEEMELKRKFAEHKFALKDAKLMQEKEIVMLLYNGIEMKQEEKGFTFSGDAMKLIREEETLEYLLDMMKWKRETSTQTSDKEMQSKQEEAMIAFIIYILQWRREDLESKPSPDEKNLNRQKAPFRFMAKEIELRRRIAKLDFRLKDMKFEREEPEVEGKKEKIEMELKGEKGMWQSQLKEMNLERDKLMKQFQLEEIEFEREENEQESVEAMQLKQELAEKECELQNVKLQRSVVSQASLINKMILTHNKSQTTAAEKIELKREEAELESLVEEIHLKHGIAKLQLLLLDSDLTPEETEPQSSAEEMELEKQIRELEFLLHEVKLKRLTAKTEFLLQGMTLKKKKAKLKALAMEIKLKRDLAELELQLKKMELKRAKGKLQPSLEEVNLKRIKAEMKSSVEVMELTRMIEILKFIAGEIDMEEEPSISSDPEEETIDLGQFEVELKRIEEDKEEGEELERGTSKVGMGGGVEMKGTIDEKLARRIETRHIFVLGGRGQDGESLRSVEGYIFRAGRWIHLPPMNTPRSCMSSVLFGNDIIVSGGDTGPEVTDTIEILPLDVTPLQWKTSPATLPVPLSGHQTVVYRGKLIAIGGYNGDEGFNSDKIYEVCLTPPYSTNILCFMPRTRAGHGAELIDDEIFIFGGTNVFAPNDDVLVYNLVTREFRVMESLPYAVHGMATVRQSGIVILLGGIDQNEEELDRVIAYNIQSGEVHTLPAMMEKRGGCCAVRSVMPDSIRGCSSDETTEILVALGSSRDIKTTECYDFRSQRWKGMPPSSLPRKHSTMVASPTELNFV